MSNNIIDMKDKRIINLLWKDARMTNSAISKQIGVSREVVNYRIKRLEELGIITKYITLVDTAKLGYSTFQVLLRLKNTQNNKEEEIIEKIKSHPFIKWIISTGGEYDLLFVMIAKNRFEFDKQLSELTSQFSENISEVSILNSIKLLKDVEFFYDNIEPIDKTHKEETVDAKKEEFEINLKREDYEILNIISEHARINVVDIAVKLKKLKIKLTPEAISYKLKKYNKEEIIRGYRVVLDYSKLGYLWYLLLLKINNMTIDKEKSLREELKLNKRVYYTDKIFGEWNIKIELLVKNHIEFYNELKNIRNNLSNEINKYDLLVVFKDQMMISFTNGIYNEGLLKHLV